MSDELSPDEANLSKRERQKQRRERKLAEQATARRAARRKRMVALGVIVVVVLGLIAAATASFLADRAERSEAVAAAADKLDDFGCTPITEQPDEGAGHFTGQELVQTPPDVAYQNRPATSGPHIGSWAMTGVYDKAIDERLLVHNLEHGYTVFWYDAEAPAEDVEALKSWAQEQIDGDFPKIVVAQYPDTLPEGGFATVSWNVSQTCESFDPQIGLAFLDQHNGLDSGAPEMTLPPHMAAGGGTLDPEAEDFPGDMLFPPLGESGTQGQGMEPGATEDIDEEGQLEDEATEGSTTGAPTDATTGEPTG
ncbi:hypothetical protein BH23ACT8_BH23ACT8_14250 [soil metagenome]